MTDFKLLEVNPWFSVVQYGCAKLKVNFRKTYGRDGKLNIAMVDYETGITLMQLVSTQFDLHLMEEDFNKASFIVNKKKDKSYIELLKQLGMVMFKKDLTDKLALYEFNKNYCSIAIV